MPQGIYLPEGLRLESRQNLRYTADRSGMARAMADGAILEGEAVACSAEGDLTVRMGGLEGIIPRAEAVLDESKPIAILSRVGRPVCFTVIGRQGERYILSRRAAQQAARAYFTEYLEPGDVVRCRVTHMESFGAFVDLGCGLPALIGIENISVSRISHPGDRFMPGQIISAVVLSVDRTGGRVVLTHRELLGTWEENAARFHVGETVAGIVRSVEPYGIFVELAPNLAGLAEPHPHVRVGQQAAVYIKSVQPEKLKIKLALIDAQDNDQPPAPPEYFITEGPLTYWRYSPEGCSRVIERRFYVD